MSPAVSRDHTVASWLTDIPPPPRLDRAEELARDVRTFLHLATTLGLSSNEERVLLDLTSCDMSLLRLAPANAFQLGRAKLERRVRYANRIMRRMLLASS